MSEPGVEPLVVDKICRKFFRAGRSIFPLMYSPLKNKLIDISVC